MKTGDIALIKQFQLTDDPFKRRSIEQIIVTAKVVSVYYPSFTVMLDKPGPNGEKYQDFHINHISDGSVTIKEGNLKTVLAVIAEIIAQVKAQMDPSDAEKVRDLPLMTLSAVLKLEQICQEHLGDE